MADGYIYKITSPSGRIYVGQTVDLKNRLSAYRATKAASQPKLHRSILKYGWDAHKFEIVEKCSLGEGKQNINEREIYWISYFDSFKNGLNACAGGYGPLGTKLSEETKNKMSQAKKGKTFTDTHKQNLSKSKSGMNNGIPAVSVVVYDINGIFIDEFDTIKECIENMNSKGYKLLDCKIRQVCQGKRKSHSKLIFRYK